MKIAARVLFARVVLMMGGIFASQASFASHFEKCDVTAKVLLGEEISIFDKGSAMVPAGVNPDGKEVYSYVKLMKLTVTDLEGDQSRNSRDCQKMLNHSFVVAVDSKITPPALKMDQSVKFTRTRLKGITPSGFAKSETWKLR